MKTLSKKIALILTFVLGAINISPAIKAYAHTTSNNLSKISCSNEQNSISTVSYTHLDVYKRQVFQCLMEFQRQN